MSYRYIAETLQVGLGLPGTGLEREAILTYTWGLGISEGDTGAAAQARHIPFKEQCRNSRSSLVGSEFMISRSWCS